MKLTPWFSGDQKPARPGVYERDYGDSPCEFGSVVWFCRWGGAYWYAPSRSHGLASTENNVSIRQSLPWRGILRNGK